MRSAIACQLRFHPSSGDLVLRPRSIAVVCQSARLVQELVDLPLRSGILEDDSDPRKASTLLRDVPTGGNRPGVHRGGRNVGAIPVEAPGEEGPLVVVQLRRREPVDLVGL
eukprot:15830098-Heterocapsa_arctica.AAC.1